MEINQKAMRTLYQLFSIFLLLSWWYVPDSDAAEQFVDFSSGDFLLNRSENMEIYIDKNDQKGVNHAAEDLCEDICKVCGSKVTISENQRAGILVGTFGHSREVDRLLGRKALELKIVGKVPGKERD